MTKAADIIVELAEDRPRAHKFLFAHRHRKASPEFHDDIIRFLHNGYAYGVIMAFRGAAKSTLAEEDVVLDAWMQMFRNCVIVGASENRAKERLAAIKREFEMNEDGRTLFGDQVGVPWQETKIVLKNGVCIQAIGRDQAVRGLKHLDWRPDYILVDDVEDTENVQSAEGRRKTMEWFMAALLPSADPDAKVRILATPLDKESVPQRLIDEDKWPKLIIPIEYVDEDGVRQPSWPALFPLETIDEKMGSYRRLGLMHLWSAEFMLQPIAAGDRMFKRPPVIPRVRTWEATFAMIDPARTIKSTSSATGVAVWSWIGNRLVVWRARAEVWRPDEIIKHLFWINERFRPVFIGFEQDGLAEWALQPIRRKQVELGILLPLKPMLAPRDKSKIEFIKMLQPLSEDELIECAEECPDLVEQFISYPLGKNDVANALAYAMLMRPPKPIYENWTTDHIAQDISVEPIFPVYLAWHATNSITTAVMLQVVGKETRILADFAAEGDTGETVPIIARAAQVMYPDLSHVAGPGHWERYTNVGLRQSLARLPATVARGVEPDRGRNILREEFDRRLRGMPTVRISQRAKLTLNGLAGGYTRSLRADGTLSAEPDPGLYRTALEGLESAIGMTANAEIDSNVNYAYTRDGRRYIRYGNAIADRR